VLCDLNPLLKTGHGAACCPDDGFFTNTHGRAAAALQMGDRVVSWDGVAMLDGETRRLLKDVVSPAESHILVIERARSPTIDGSLRRDPMAEEEMNVDNDKEEALLGGALIVVSLAVIVSASGVL
jgi:hypothetical protein